MLWSLAAAALLVVLVGWLLKIGQDILIPIRTAVISVYILTTAADALGRVPGGVRLLPSGARRFLVLLAFAAVVAVLASVVIVTAQQLVAKAPRIRPISNR
ncbi:MAG: hypothetical protein R3E68_13135 [Burkholderiaceae bacterium]